MLDLIVNKYNYWIYITLMMIGFYAMIGKKNLVKKIIGMNIFQVAHYLNPLPHVLMLTAIVVMVSTLGVALAILINVYRRYNTLEEDEILQFKK
jgi:multicomponent Na+:H+ antiporter subunit C